jgi:putative flippase GtrA
MALLSQLTDRVVTAWHERAILLKAISFGMVGVVNTLVDATIFFIALNTITSSLVVANVFSWIVGVSGSYVMNSYFTFAHESGRQLRWRSYGKFVASGVLGAVISTTTLVIAARFMPVWAAKGCAILASFMVNFSMSHFVVFGQNRKPHPTP